MSNPFTDHPKDVGMNYFQHFIFAFSVVGKLIAATFCCTIHAFFPFIFTNTTSRIVKNLHGLIDPSKRH